jgi:O-antigen ligase
MERTTQHRPDESLNIDVGTSTRAARLSWPVFAFLVGVVVPWVIMIGSLRLSVYRMVLVVMIVPCLVKLMRGAAGRVKLADISIIVYCLWGAICLSVIHGTSTALQGGGIIFVESVGAYLMGRCFIRNSDDFRNMIWLIFAIILFMLPFGIIETITGQKPLLKLYALVMPTIEAFNMDRRWGLWRVQGPFEHPILFGVCCGSILALTHMVLGYQQSFFRRWFKSALVAATAFLALSSGPITALIAQVLLMTWNRVLSPIKERWTLLWALVIFMNVAVFFYSGESVARFFVSHAPLFDSFSAYYRLLIWEHGSATVLNHPIFGIGYNEYERPEWMVPSVDMFWLIHGIMFGLPGAILMALTFVSAVTSVSRQSIVVPKIREYRTAYLISMAGFFCVGWTVHFWNGTYVLFLFLLAAGMWMAEVQPNEKAAEADQSLRSRRAKALHADASTIRTQRPSRS